MSIRLTLRTSRRTRSGRAMLVAFVVASGGLGTASAAGATPPVFASAGFGADRSGFGPPPPANLTPLPEPARQDLPAGPIPGDVGFSGDLSPTDPYDLAFVQVRPGRHSVQLHAYAPAQPGVVRESGPDITLSEGTRYGAEIDAQPYTGTSTDRDLLVYGPRLLILRVGPYLNDDANSGSLHRWGFSVGPARALIASRRPGSYFAPATCRPTDRHLKRHQTLEFRCRHLHTGDPVTTSWRPPSASHFDPPPTRTRRARQGRVRVSTREVHAGRYALMLTRGDDVLFSGRVSVG